MRHAASVCVYVFICGKPISSVLRLCATNKHAIYCYLRFCTAIRPRSHRDARVFLRTLTATQIFIIFIWTVHSSHAALAGIVSGLGRTFRARLIATVFSHQPWSLCGSAKSFILQISKFMLHNYFIHLTHCHKSETRSEQATDETI